MLRAPLVLAALASAAFAQTPGCATVTPAATYPANPLHYPKPSDRYTVQYRLGGGSWVDATVNISYYGGTVASPLLSYSGYTGETSMSFTSIPTGPNVDVELRVTKLWNAPFMAGDQVSIRPTAKRIESRLESQGTVLITTRTAAAFAGEQFLLWWQRGAEGGAVESLAFFLDPIYQRPEGANVKKVITPSDLEGDLSAFDTLDFEGQVVINSTGNAAFPVPANILNVFLGPGAWVQGKLSFDLQQLGKFRHIYGPGVLDVSRFRYDNRNCPGDDGAYALSSTGANGVLKHYQIDGIVITDHNHAVNDAFFNSTVNNVKTLGWNGENAALRLNDSTAASNLFVRSGDDSLMMWGMGVTVTNATVWQNYNGGVVNLGWSYNSPGDYCLLDGLYVVKTDWSVPATANWTTPAPPASPLNNQNNGVFTSLMVPGTNFGKMQRPVYRNIFVEDRPQVLLSLKILPPDCNLNGGCPQVTLTDMSYVYLTIENLVSPPSIAQNSIGFENLPANYSQEGQTFPAGYTFTGTMDIRLVNVLIQTASGLVPVTSANSLSVGQILPPNGNTVTIQYGR